MMTNVIITNIASLYRNYFPVFSVDMSLNSLALFSDGVIQHSSASISRATLSYVV